MSVSIGRGPFFVLAAALCFSTSGFSQAIAPEGASPYTISAMRLFIGGCALFIWCAVRGILPLHGLKPLKNVIAASLGLVGCNVFFFKGMAEVGVVVGTVVTLGSIPIFTALLGLLFLAEKPLRAWYPATAAAICGLVLLHWGGAGAVNPLHLLLPLAAGLSYSTFMVAGKKLVRNYHPESMQMVLCLLSGLCLFPALFFYPADWLFTARGALVALNLGLTTSAMAFTLLMAGLRTTPTAVASTLNLAEPLCASLIGILYLKEPVTSFTMAGLSCIFAAMFLLVLLPAQSRALRAGNY